MIVAKCSECFEDCVIESDGTVAIHGGIAPCDGSGQAPATDEDVKWYDSFVAGLS